MYSYKISLNIFNYKLQHEHLRCELQPVNELIIKLD